MRLLRWPAFLTHTRFFATTFRRRLSGRRRDDAEAAKAALEEFYASDRRCRGLFYTTSGAKTRLRQRYRGVQERERGTEAKIAVHNDWAYLNGKLAHDVHPFGGTR